MLFEESGVQVHHPCYSSPELQRGIAGVMSDVKVKETPGGTARRRGWPRNVAIPLVLTGKGDPATVRRKSRHHVATTPRPSTVTPCPRHGEHRPEVVMSDKDYGVAAEGGISHQRATV